MSRGAVGGGHKVGLARVARKAGPWWGGLGEASPPPASWESGSVQAAGVPARWDSGPNGGHMQERLPVAPLETRSRRRLGGGVWAGENGCAGHPGGQCPQWGPWAQLDLSPGRGT